MKGAISAQFYQNALNAKVTNTGMKLIVRDVKGIKYMNLPPKNVNVLNSTRLRMKVIVFIVVVLVSLISKPIHAFNAPLALSSMKNLKGVYQSVPKTLSITLLSEDVNVQRKDHSIMEKYVLLVYFLPIGIKMKNNVCVVSKDKCLT